MAFIAGLNVLFWMLFWGAAMRLYEMHFVDSDNALGSSARALAVIY